MSKLTLTDIAQNRKAIKESAVKNGITIIGLFGPLVGSEDYFEGDIHFLIELQPEKSIFDVARFEMAIKNIFSSKGELTVHCPTNKGIEKSIKDYLITRDQATLILTTAKQNTFDNLLERNQPPSIYSDHDHTSLFSDTKPKPSTLFPYNMEPNSDTNNQYTITPTSIQKLKESIPSIQSSTGDELTLAIKNFEAASTKLGKDDQEKPETIDPVNLSKNFGYCSKYSTDYFRAERQLFIAVQSAFIQQNTKKPSEQPPPSPNSLSELNKQLHSLQVK